MPNKKITFVKSDIVREMQGHFQEIPNNDVERIVDKIFQYLINSLAEGRSIELRNWGMLSVKSMKERRARNPRSGQEITVPAKKKVKWKSSKNLNYRLNFSKGDKIEE